MAEVLFKPGRTQNSRGDLQDLMVTPGKVGSLGFLIALENIPLANESLFAELWLLLH